MSFNRFFISYFGFMGNVGSFQCQFNISYSFCFWNHSTIEDSIEDSVLGVNSDPASFDLGRVVLHTSYCPESFIWCPMQLQLCLEDLSFGMRNSFD